MTDKLSGVFVPVITPFSNQRPDLEKLSFNIRKLNSSKVRGYMPLGSNGEFSHMNDEEQLSVLKTVKSNASKEKVIIAGIARNSAYSTIEFGKRAEEIGVDYMSVLTPSYYTSFMTDAALIKYYEAVADGLKTPVLLYNCPMYTAGISLSEEVIKTLSRHPNIHGMKDTLSGNLLKYIAAKGDADFEVMPGNINEFLMGLKAGSPGAVIAVSNYLPDECCTIQELFNEGKLNEAEKFSSEFINIIKNSAGKYAISGVKASCDLLGFKGGEVRNPLMDCTPEQRNTIRRVFSEAGYL